MQNIDQQFVEYIVKALAEKPEDVQIERTIDERGVLLKLSVSPEDLGRVIGKAGATAQAIRTLLRALGLKDGAHYNLKIVDTDGGANAKPAARDDEVSEVGGPVVEPIAVAPVETVTDEPVENSFAEAESQKNSLEGLDALDDLDV
ncbi:MAG: KH domain-containing protein [Candidatus Nomurabacteria bacterium]|jgi:predicted RNA-binding protein YlqC (UPF0109 family)|nr:KH domain-containing protein [Candidatus Nomurabacteria bacterium]